MKVALVHYWLVTMRGGEKVLEALGEVYPQADIFTHVYDPDAVSGALRAHRIKTTFVQKLPGARRLYKNYLPLMPLALEQLDLKAYDLVISSESGPAKGVITRPDTLHVCYCHTPMRYLWDLYDVYRKEANLVQWAAMPVLTHFLRQWDVSSAGRVDRFIANSHTVKNRIARSYRRDADVIYPPVDVDAFHVASEPEDFFLVAGQLTAYKRADLAVQAFNRMGRRLVVIGAGEQLKFLRRIAGPSVSVLGPQPFEVLRDHFARCRALVFPGEEDFGIVPVEAMASGRPVIAYGAGGATETVVDNETGILFDDQSLQSLIDAVERFETMWFSADRLREHAKQFGKERFKTEIRHTIDTYLCR